MIKSHKTRAVVKATGSALPSRILTNRDLEAMVDTTDDWIVQRTGIRQRRICAEGESTGTLCIEAGRKALAASGLEAEEIDLVVVATVTGEFIWPATACFVQDALGAVNAGAFDISAACAGFIYGMSVVASLIENGQVEKVLLIGADCLSKQVNWKDRSTCILFGDAAAGCVMVRELGTDRGLIQTVLMAHGAGSKHIILERGGSKYPYGVPGSEEKSDKIFMAGQEVYRFAVNAMGEACEKVLDRAGICPSEVDLFVPHQANLRIIESAAKRLNLPEDKVFVNVDRYGNTSGASIPLALDEASSSGRLKQGMLVMTVGFGAGLVWGANLLRW